MYSLILGYSLLLLDKEVILLELLKEFYKLKNV